MSSSIPNSMSSDHLNELLQAAKENLGMDENVDNTHNFSEEYLTELASKICDDACDQSHGPMIHKIILLTILSRMIIWHTNVGEEMSRDGNTSAIGWLRDAGKLQAAAAAIQSVSLGPDDFTNSGEA